MQISYTRFMILRKWFSGLEPTRLSAFLKNSMYTWTTNYHEVVFFIAHLHLQFPTRCQNDWMLHIKNFSKDYSRFIFQTNRCAFSSHVLSFQDLISWNFLIRLVGTRIVFVIYNFGKISIMRNDDRTVDRPAAGRVKWDCGQIGGEQIGQLGAIGPRRRRVKAGRSVSQLSDAPSFATSVRNPACSPFV